MTIRDNRQLVAALLDVVGVASASIEETNGGPGTLRLQLDAGTDQVVVAGEVNRLLRSKFGLAVDPDRVRVVDEPLPTELDAPPASSAAGRHSAAATAEGGPANGEGHQMGGQAPAAVGAYARDVAGLTTDANIATDLRVTNGVDHSPAPTVTLARPSRLSIDRVQLVSVGLGVVVTVTLGLDGRSVDGEAEGAATQTGVHRSVATATLRAVERIIDGSARFEVEHLEIARAGTDRTALVVVTMVTGRSSQRLSGASVVRDDTRQAVIRAVLAALNRRMELLLAEH